MAGKEDLPRNPNTSPDLEIDLTKLEQWSISEMEKAEASKDLSQLACSHYKGVVVAAIIETNQTQLRPYHSFASVLDDLDNKFPDEKLHTERLEASCAYSAEDWLKTHPLSKSARAIAAYGMEARFESHQELVFEMYFEAQEKHV